MLIKSLIQYRNKIFCSYEKSEGESADSYNVDFLLHHNIYIQNKSDLVIGGKIEWILKKKKSVQLKIISRILL